MGLGEWTVREAPTAVGKGVRGTKGAYAETVSTFRHKMHQTEMPKASREAGFAHL